MLYDRKSTLGVLLVAAMLVGVPGASADVPESERQRLAPDLVQSQRSTDSKAVKMIGEDGFMHVGRVLGGTPVPSKDGNVATSRAAGGLALGETCSCDEDCADAGDQCNIVQCIVRGLCTGDNATPCSTDGDCTVNGTCDTTSGTLVQRCDMVQLIVWPCDADADFCTLDRCEDDGTGNNTSVCVAQSDGGGGALSPCAKHCDGGPAHRRGCDRASDCFQGSCQIIAGAACDSAAEVCYVGQSLAAAKGRCCGDTDEVCRELTLAECIDAGTCSVSGTCSEFPFDNCVLSLGGAACPGAQTCDPINCQGSLGETDCPGGESCDTINGVWYRYRSPDEVVGKGQCVCPSYGSGVAPPGIDGGSSAAFGLVRPSGLICQTGSAQTSTEVYCETAGTDSKFCQNRCVGGDNAGQPCVIDNPDCANFGVCSVGGTLCVVANGGSDCGICSESGAGCDGTAIQPCPGGATDICEFNVAQICNPLNSGTCLPDVCGPNTTEGSCEDGFLSIGDDYSLADASFLRLTQFRFSGGITNLGEDFVIEFWNTAGTKLIDAFAVNDLSRTGLHDWTIEVDCWPNCDPFHFELPEQSPIIIPPTGYLVMRATRTVGTTDGAAAFWEQTDDPSDVGLNDETKAWVNGDPNGSLGTNVFIFELVGTKVPDPLGACCTDTESCQDTPRWDCGICSVTEPQVACASTLHDCPDALGLNSTCQFNRWFGPISHDDFQGAGTDLTLCNGNVPCDSGACCDGETCTVQTPADCVAAGAVFQGIATGCNPNCCPVDNPTGSDCICPTSTCVEIALSCLGGADEGASCTTSAECAVTDPLDPGVCGNLNTGNLCTSDADCSDVNGECVLQCSPVGVTQHRHPYECHDDIGSPLEPRQDCDPALADAVTCPPIACTTLADCPLGTFACIGGFCEDSLAMTCEQSFTGAHPVVRNDTITGDLFTATEGDRCSLNPTTDRNGWFEPFNLPDPTPGDNSDDCYHLTIGLCCTDPVLNPIWPFLSSFKNCPCAEGADVIAQAPDIDISGDPLDGFGADSKASLAGRCEDGNYSATFTVPPGDYAYQINADTACSGSIIGCDDDDDCPGSSCNVPNPNYSVVFTTESCQIAACCVGSTCILTNELDCRAQEGIYLGGGDQPIVTCQAGACSLGSCCVSGQCTDHVDFDSQAECDGVDGVYVGGVGCDANPCAACPFDFAANCQQVQTIFGPVPLVDRNPNRNSESTKGRVVVDDVKFGGHVVNQICWNIGHYAEPCCDDCGFTPFVDHTWEIRVYDTDPDCSGLPGTQVGNMSKITVLNKIQGTGQGSNTWQYSGSLNDPIILPNAGLAGDTYWFEVSAFGEPGCGVRANWSRDHGNEHYVAAQVDPVTEARDYNLAGIGALDIAFCENSGILNPGEVLGSCCTCFATCKENFTQSECLVIDGVWLACATCAESPCPGAPANDHCETPFLVSNVPESEDGIDVLIITGQDNICADTDGPALSVTGGCRESLSGIADMFNDVWYKYKATACGDLTIESCGAANMDQMLAVYDATDGCPLTRSAELACDDDTCGIAAGPATVTVRVFQDREYLIRMGGWRSIHGNVGDPRGSFDFIWSLRTGVCPLVVPPIRAPSPHAFLKNRYISIDPRGAKQINPSSHHIRLMVESSQVGGQVGSEPWWAGPPGPGNDLCQTPCISMVTTTKPASEPDWSGCPVVHLTGCPIIPTSTYAIAAESGGELSAEVFLDTQAKPGIKWHGDCVGAFSGTEWTGPNGQVNIDDAVAAIKTFQDCNAINATHLSVTDVAPNLPPAGPNKIVNIEDVVIIILGFGGQEYPGSDLTQCP